MLVVGYHQELIRAAYPNFHYVENPNFAQENTSKSLLRALETIPNEDVLWLNGDVLFRKEVFSLLLHPRRTAMVVNRTRVGEEEVKYRTDGHGKVVEISKTLDRPEGESLGIHYFCRKDVPALLEGLRCCQPMDYFEAAIQYAIKKGTEVSAIEVADTDCLEIDFPEDLILANQRLKLWNQVRGNRSNG